MFAHLRRWKPPRLSAVALAISLAAVPLAPAQSAWADAPALSAAGDTSHAVSLGFMQGFISLLNLRGVLAPSTTDIDEQSTPLGAVDAPESPVPDDTPEGPVSAADTTARERAEMVLTLVNAERAAAGLAALSETGALSDAAAIRAGELETVFSHTRPDGENSFSVLDELGINRTTSAENAAFGQPTPESVVEGWMDSESHRVNMLSPEFARAGAGVYESASGTLYWILLFTD